MYRVRKLVVQVVLEDVDEQNNVVNEQTMNPIHVFPKFWPDLFTNIEKAAADFNVRNGYKTPKPQ